jgi:hypothetical protein
MGLSARQLALCSEWVWLILPSTGKSGFGAAPASTGGIPAAARRVGPYRAHPSDERSARRTADNEARNLGGTVIVASTVAPSTLVQSVLVSATTSPTAGQIYPVTDVRTYHYRGAVHHVSLRLSR